jgi:hypothetical protein
MKHVIFIVTMLVLGVGAGVWFMHVREQMREEAALAADAAVVKPPPDAAVVPVVEDVPPPPATTTIDAATACDEIACALNDYPGECCAKFRPPPEAKADDCDEVSCVLDDYVRPCCAQYRRPAKPREVVADPSPQALDRKMISDGVNSVKSRIMACATSEVRGTLKVRVRVAPSGVVTSVTVAATPDPKLAMCVRNVINSILFAPTQTGGSFSYPFIF